MVNRKPPPDPRVTAALVEFGGEIKNVMLLTGRHVTYRWLEEQSRARGGMPLPKAGLSRLLNGQIEPDWHVVQQILMPEPLPRPQTTRPAPFPPGGRRSSGPSLGGV